MHNLLQCAFQASAHTMHALQHSATNQSLHVQRQEDISVDVRLVAFFKISFLTLAAAHWLGCIFMWLASYADMDGGSLSMVWLESWIHHFFVGYGTSCAGTYF